MPLGLFGKTYQLSEDEFCADTPVELIMKISGHKSLRDFHKYIRISPEEAGQKIKQIWQQRRYIETE